MAMKLVVHLVGEDAFLAEIDEMPDPSHAFVVMRYVRQRDRKELAYVTGGATAFLFPWHRISFLEMMDEVPGVATADGDAPVTQILGSFREDEHRR